MAAENTAEKLLQIARGYLGSTDGDFFIRKYNGNTGAGIPLGSAWCAIFVSCVARMAGVPVREIPDFHGCITGTRKFKNFSRWKDPASYTPKPGDVIIFDWNPAGNDGQDHTGFVEAVKNGRVYTIEGNAGSGICMKRDYPLDSAAIDGYGVPQYAVQETEDTQGEPEMTKEDVQKIIAEYEAQKEQRTVSVWAKEAWEQAVAAKLLDGTAPRGPLTREQAALVLSRAGLLEKRT